MFGLKISSESKLFGGGPPCPCTTSATLNADKRADLSLTALDLGQDKGNFIHSVNSSTMY